MYVFTKWIDISVQPQKCTFLLVFFVDKQPSFSLYSLQNLQHLHSRINIYKANVTPSNMLALHFRFEYFFF